MNAIILEGMVWLRRYRLILAMIYEELLYGIADNRENRIHEKKPELVVRSSLVSVRMRNTEMRWVRHRVS